ncbi:MAG: methylglyoxal synthase [Candidatus Dormiibacterota bacterium]
MDARPRPRVAIIAHDGKKADLVAFATYNRNRLKTCNLLATSHTGSLLEEKVGLSVERFPSGPLGGDVQVAAQVVDGEIDAVLFIVDPLGKHPHDPDIQTLLRICNVHDVPLATNIATADVLMGSEVLWEKARSRADARLRRRVMARSEEGAAGEGTANGS